MDKKLFSYGITIVVFVLVLAFVLLVFFGPKNVLLDNNSNQNELGDGNSSIIDSNNSDLTNDMDDSNSQTKKPLVIGEVIDSTTPEELSTSIGLCLDKCKNLRENCTIEGLELKPDATGCYLPSPDLIQSDENCETNCFVQ